VKRELELDAARGLMLVWMTLTHLPTVFTAWVNQPFGYVSASDGFIFLSALFTGRIYYRLLARSGAWKMSARILSRTLRLYGYHLLLLLFAFAVAARFAIDSKSEALYNLLDFYFAAGPGRAIVDALLLIYRPPLLDIVPLYIIFLLLSPLVIIVAGRIGWKPILATSFALWVLAQFGLREASYAFLAHHAGLRIPLNEMGAFNLWAWQLVWMTGMWCGVRWAKEDLPAEKWAARMWIPAAVVVAALLVMRRAELAGLLTLGVHAGWFDKWHVGAGRLVNFSAVTVLLIYFRSVVKPLAVRPLVLLGQSSLQVFITHFFFCFLGIGMMGAAERIFGWRQFVLVGATFTALFVVAKISAAHKAGVVAARDGEAPVAMAVAAAVAAVSAGAVGDAAISTAGPISAVAAAGGFVREAELPGVGDVARTGPA
jgi:hypothetical protein